MKRITSSLSCALVALVALPAAVALAQSDTQQKDDQQMDQPKQQQQQAEPQQAAPPQADPQQAEPQKAEPQKAEPQKDQMPKDQQPQGESAAAPVVGGSTLGVTVIQKEKLLTGWSAKRDLLNTNIKNDNGERIGRVQDLIVAPDGSVSAAIIGVGGFVGMGKHNVAIPTDEFKFQDGAFTLPGATKDALKALPEFEYAPKGHTTPAS
jgi:hypothetical protein